MAANEDKIKTSGNLARLSCQTFRFWTFDGLLKYTYLDKLKINQISYEEAQHQHWYFQFPLSPFSFIPGYPQRRIILISGGGSLIAQLETHPIFYFPHHLGPERWHLCIGLGILRTRACVGENWMDAAASICQIAKFCGDESAVETKAGRD